MTRLTRKTLFGALCATTLLAAPALAFDPAKMSDAEREGFNEAVKTYLLENPEILIEAMSVLEERRVAAEAQNDSAMVQTNAEAIFDDGYSWVGGNPDGDITVVEFMDYRCSYCRKAFEEVEELVSTDGNIRFVLKEFPILGEQSDMASRFAIAVKQIAGDDKYKEVHDKLMAVRGDFTLDSLSRVAKDSGLDADEVIGRMNTEEVTAVIRANHQLAEKMRIMGTPTFAFGDELLRGYLPLDGMRERVEAARAKG